MELDHLPPLLIVRVWQPMAITTPGYGTAARVPVGLEHDGELVGVTRLLLCRSPFVLVEYEVWDEGAAVELIDNINRTQPPGTVVAAAALRPELLNLFEHNVEPLVDRVGVN